MSRRSPYRIELVATEREALEGTLRRPSASQAAVQRARIVLLAADGLRNDEIAARCGIVRPTASKWRKRFFEQRAAGLRDRPRSGRPRAFPPSGGGRDQGPRLRATG
jgi:DNA-binding CsgD family transcriptional regulator